MTIERVDDRSWDAMRGEYEAGGVSLAALARTHGVTVYAVRKRARDEGWARRKAAPAREPGRPGDPAFPADAREDWGATGEADVAERVRRRLLLKLERATDEMPGDATEVKTQEEGGTVKLLKLRDLTAAYKELVGDIPREGAGREESRVILDV